MSKNLGEFITRGAAIGNKFNDLVTEVKSLAVLVLDTVLDTSTPSTPAKRVTIRTAEDLAKLNHNSVVYSLAALQSYRKDDWLWFEYDKNGQKTGRGFTASALIEEQGSVWHDPR